MKAFKAPVAAALLPEAGKLGSRCPQALRQGGSVSASARLGPLFSYKESGLWGVALITARGHFWVLPLAGRNHPLLPSLPHQVLFTLTQQSTVVTRLQTCLPTL